MTSNYVFKKRDPKKVQQATLCFLINKNHVLLAMKKRGFAVGLWNGVGGKVKSDSETIEQALVRETKEEIDIEIVDTHKVALLHFYFPDDPEKVGWNQDVHVYITEKWKGNPSETDEMRPEWFKKHLIPYEKMWSDDKIWLPKVLAGETIEAWFAMDDNNNIISFKIKEL